MDRSSTYRLNVIIKTSQGPWLQTLFPDATLLTHSATEVEIAHQLEDMAAVYGFLLRIRDAGLCVQSIHVNALDDVINS